MTFTSALIVERTSQGSRASVKEQGKNVQVQPSLKVTSKISDLSKFDSNVKLLSILITFWAQLPKW